MTQAPPPPADDRPPPVAPSGQPPSAPPPPVAPSGGYPPPSGGYGMPAAPPPPGYSPPAYPGGGTLSPQEERTWAMLAHLSALLGLVVGLSFIGPLVVMLTQGQKSPFVRDQAVEALNFQITTYLATIVGVVLILVLVGLILLPIIGLLWLVFTIMASVAANKGERYRYPFNIRLVK
jgi:uncharacterized Tic20 family protein